MTDTKDLIREIQEHTAAHGGENTATHLLVQAVMALQHQADELAAIGAGGVSGPLLGGTLRTQAQPVGEDAEAAARRSFPKWWNDMGASLCGVDPLASSPPQTYAARGFMGGYVAALAAQAPQQAAPAGEASLPVEITPEMCRLHALTQGTQPTDDEIVALADSTGTAEGGTNGYILPISFARAVIAKWGTPATGGEPVAWIRFQPPYRPDVLVQRHRPTLDGEPDTQYRPLVFGDTSPQPVREPLNIVELMRVVMKADEESQDTRGTTNWAAHIGKAVQTAVLSGGVQPVREPLTSEQRNAIFDKLKFISDNGWEVSWWRVVDEVEAALGIKGGQHDPNT